MAQTLGTRLGEKPKQVTPQEKATAEKNLAWSREQVVPVEENHRTAVEKG